MLFASLQMPFDKIEHYFWFFSDSTLNFTYEYLNWFPEATMHIIFTGFILSSHFCNCCPIHYLNFIWYCTAQNKMPNVSNNCIVFIFPCKTAWKTINPVKRQKGSHCTTNEPKASGSINAYLNIDTNKQMFCLTILNSLQSLSKWYGGVRSFSIQN